MWVGLAASVVVVAYNNLVNRWPPFHSSAYIPINLAFAGGMAAVVTRATAYSWGDLFGRFHPADVVLPVILVVVFAFAIFALVTSRHAHHIADRRVAGMDGRALAFYVLVRIPMGTALAEEVMFRGVMFAAG
ncbi:MAG TPA: hypothetical protein VG929_09705 [Actinomycetota bacterium]|nr:hypothetical protein [Actinomycetota bacterium]